MAEHEENRGRARFEALFGEDEPIPDGLAAQEPPGPEEEPAEDLETAEELARLREQAVDPLHRMVYEDERARSALERRRAILEKEVADPPEPARVDRSLIERPEDGFFLGSITRVATPPYVLNVPKELRDSGAGRVHDVEAADGFVSFNMSSGWGKGEARARALTGLRFTPPMDGRLTVRSLADVSHHYWTADNIFNATRAYGRLSLRVSRYSPQWRFLRIEDQDHGVLFNEKGSGSSSRTYSRLYFSNVRVRPQYRYVLWMRLYGKVLSEGSDGLYANLFQTYASGSVEAYVSYIRYTCY